MLSAERGDVADGFRLIFSYHQRRESHAGFIQHQQARAAHQRARHRDHLLLAAGQCSGELVFLRSARRGRVRICVPGPRRFRVDCCGCMRPLQILCTVRRANTPRPSGTRAMPIATRWCAATFCRFCRRSGFVRRPDGEGPPVFSAWWSSPRRCCRSARPVRRGRCAGRCL